MLQFIMERNLLLYMIAAFCVAGTASQIILKQLYERLIRDTQNVGTPDGKFLQQLRQRFQYCSHLNEKVGNVQALIQKSIMEYRFWGMSLHRWKRIGAECLVLSILCAFAGSVMTVRGGGAVVSENIYFGMGVFACVLTALVYGLADTGYQKESLEIRLADYLENSGAVKDYSENLEEGYEKETVTPIMPVVSGRKAKKQARAEAAAAAQSKAQREKNELKENLARVRAGMQETAASGGEKIRSSDILRQMDPKEQERILKEVLREVLS